MTLHPKQKQIVNSNKRFRVVIAGRRGGKTVLSINELLGKAFFTENGLVVYIAPTNEDVRDIIWRELKNMARAVVVKQNDVKMEMEIQNKYGGTSLIKTASWESIINKGRLRGQKFHFVVMDEVSSYKAFWVGWEEIIRPTLTDYKGDVLFIGTPKGYNHFHDLYNYEANDEDFGSFHFTSYDNPYIDPKEIDKARGQMTVDRFSQEYMGEFKKMEGLVYPMFSRFTHLIDDKDLEKIAITEIRVGVDFGYTNPAAVIKIIKDRDNNYYIVDEFYKTKQSTDKLIEMCKIFKAQKVYPDKAEPDRIDLMKKEGLNIMPTSKDIDAGIDAVRQLLEQKRLFIHKKCLNTINEFESYHFPEFKLEKNKPEKPYDDNNHALDAIRYALFPVIKQGNNFEAKIFIPQI